MQVEDTTDTLNKYLEDKRAQEKLDIKGHFVVKRNIETMKPPIFKKFIIELYYVTPVQDKKLIEIYSINRCISGTEDAYWIEVAREYISKVFDLMQNGTFNKLIYGNIN